MMASRVSDRQFAESRHRYTDPRTGERVVSVTSVVGCYDDGDKLGAGAYAAVKLTKEGFNYRDEWDKKRDLGTRVHTYARRWTEGRMAEVAETDMGHMDAFANWINEKHPDWLEVERAVVSSHGYGGRFDAVAYFDDRYWLIDFKTGRHYTPELTFQLAGYRFADGMIVYDADGWAKSLEDMPHIDACVGLYLQEDGTYVQVEVPAVQEDFDAFLGLLTAKNRAKALGEAATITSNKEGI